MPVESHGQRLQHAEHVDVWGTGRATREFPYVEDAARAMQLALEQYDCPAPLHIGSGMEISISDLGRLTTRKTGFSGEIRFDPTQPDGQPRRCLDISRASELFGFTATTPFERGLDRTIAWFRERRLAIHNLVMASG